MERVTQIGGAKLGSYGAAHRGPSHRGKVRSLMALAMLRYSNKDRFTAAQYKAPLRGNPVD